MNINRALNVALPEIPARTVAQRCPRMDPGFSFKEHLEDGMPVIRVYIPSSKGMYKFPPQTWELTKLFDGKRSYEEIAELYSQQNGIEYDDAEVREWAAGLEAEDFWYKTPLEKNVLLLQQSNEERQRKLKAKNIFADLSMMMFPAFNPDKFLTWLYRYTSFFYTPWCTLLTLGVFALTAGITIVHWPEIGRDTLEFYNFTHKSFSDIVQLYVLGMAVVAVHEFGHAHACKHYGGRVPAMGFALIYLTPAFYTDTTEGAVQGTRYQRMVIALAGIWAEFMICAIATPIWWNTTPGSATHNGAYFLMLLTGITSLVINWNPLIKLDGYYILCELIGISDLKEASTAYVSAWNKRHIWGLPVEVPYVPTRRRLGFAIYALLSGLYSYTILYLVAGFVGNVFRNFNPDWSFIPELATAGLIFRSRIRLLVNFMKFVYLDKKDRVRAWFTPNRSVAVAAGFVLFLCLPLWHDSAVGRFALEPAAHAVVRAVVPGVVTDVYTEEGKSVTAGAPLIRLRNLPLESRLAHSKAELLTVSHRANSLALHFGDFGPALKEKEKQAQEERELSSEASNLQLRSPIAGVVLTSRLADRLGAYAGEGQELVEVADLSMMRARIYVSEHDFYKVKTGARARLEVDGILRKWDTQTMAISPLPSQIAPGLTEHTEYKGLLPPNFYLADLMVANPAGDLKPGMVGTARIYGQRRSFAGLVWEGTKNFLGRKLW